MAYATGTRLASALCFVIGTISVVGIPILWPVGYWFYKKAKEKEQEREQEIAALSA